MMRTNATVMLMYVMHPKNDGKEGPHDTKVLRSMASDLLMLHLNEGEKKSLTALTNGKEDAEAEVN